MSIPWSSGVEEIYLTTVTLGELIAGFMRGARLRKNEDELRRFVASPRVTTLDITSETADRYAVILNALWERGTPIPTSDIWIAASAMQHGLRLLTTDAHYQNVSHVIIDFFVP